MSQSEMQHEMQHEAQHVSDRVRRYIVDNFLYMHDAYELSDDDALLGKGIVDSLGVMELISFIEEEFGVVVADADVTERNFETVAAVARYVLARGAAARPAA